MGWMQIGGCARSGEVVYSNGLLRLFLYRGFFIMADFSGGLPNLVILDTETESNGLGPSDEVFSDALSIGLVAPAVLDAVTYVIQVTRNFSASPIVWVTLQAGDPLVDVVPPLVNKARVYIDIALFDGFRIFASGAATADRAWGVIKSWRNF